jgi:hypothetical protein
MARTLWWSAEIVVTVGVVVLLLVVHHYEVTRSVPQTLFGDGTVLAPVPYSSVHPGSTYRLVGWGRLLTAASR